MSWTLYPISDFKNHHDSWQQFNLSQTASPLLDFAFISTLLQIFGSGKEVLACYQSDNQLRAMAILTLCGPGTWATFQPSQAPVGAWMHSTGMDWAPLLSSLIKKLPGFPLILSITQQDPDLLPRPEPHGSLETLDYIQTARISLEGGFDGYWNSRGKNLRQNMKKQRNKLENDAVSTRLQISTRPEEVAQAIADYGRIESAGWKGEGGTAIHPQNAQGRFYQTMLEQFCRRDAGKIYRYWYNDHIAAMDLCIEGNGSIVVLKTTYDENIGGATSPALLMRQEIFSQLFKDGKLKRIEFYGKVMEWHTKWSNELRTMYHVNKYRWPVLPLLRDIMHKRAGRISQNT
jgi:hypothetical protein